MLNKKAIFEVLNAAPLCHGHLIAQRGMATEYCAMGALAKSVGATDDYLRGSSSTGEDIWNDFGDKLREKFGIESYSQFASLMQVNDAEAFATRRNKAVLKHVDALSPDEINEIISDGLVSTESEMVEETKHFGSDE